MAAPIEMSRVNRFRAPARLRQASAKRKSRLRHFALEDLESRTLLSVLPAATHDQAVPLSVDASAGAGQSFGDESNPSISVDPVNPEKVVSVFQRRFVVNGVTVITVGGAFSNNGGQSWAPMLIPGTILDPTTSNPTVPFTQITNPSIAFDRAENVYVLVSQHNDAGSSGALIINKFDFTSTTPFLTVGNNVVHQWIGAGLEQASEPMLAVDDNVPSFTDPDTGAVQTDVFSGNVYVAWTGTDSDPSSPPNPNFNPVTIQVAASSDGGVNFSSPVAVNDNGNLGSQRNAVPRLAISQGTANGSIKGGQVTVVWDDYGSLATATPPRDIIKSDSLPGASVQVFAGPGGSVADATDPGNNMPHIPGVTTFPVTVNISDPKFFAASDLDVKLDLTHPNLSQVQIRLIPPASSGLGPIILLNNRIDAANTTTATVGASGANLGGTTTNGQYLGTVFDAEALRSIFNNGGGAASIGHFRPEFGGTSLLSSVNGLTAAQLNGTWTLEITDFRSDNGPVQSLRDWALIFNSGLNPGPDTFVTTSTVRGAVAPPYSFATAATPLGIGPAPVIASDNTLGSFSAHQGRLYLAYVDRFNPLIFSFAENNPADNSDIFLLVSDNGGVTWQSASQFRGIPLPVNDDSGAHDGFSESAAIQDIGATAAFAAGRPQFEPSVSVDQSTGTLVVSYLDTRYDAARARVATTIATSLDGGATFGPQTFANDPATAFDEITRKNVILGPIPDNQSGANPKRETTFAFGTHQGLAVAAGHIYPAWSSNLNGGLVSGDNELDLDIRVAPMVIAAGPRALSGTMGPVGLPGDSINFTRAADGTPQVTGFQVVFDRPVDRRTFGVSDVQVFYRDPSTPAGIPGTPVTVQNVTALNPFGPPGFAFEATTFLVTFAQPQSATGTYSYSIGPDVSDMIRTVQTTVIVNPGSTTVVNAPPNQVNLRIPPIGTGGSGNPSQDITKSFIQVNLPSNQAISHVSVNLSLTHTFDSDLIITLIAPDGTRVVLSNRNGFDGDNFINTTFDDQATTPISFGSPPFTGTFHPDESLGRLIGKTAQGTWELEINDVAAIDIGTLLSWSLTLQTGTKTVTFDTQSGNLMDQNANATTDELPNGGQDPGDVFQVPGPSPLNGRPFLPPYDSTTTPLIVPGPHLVGSHAVLANGQLAPSSSDNLVTNGTVGAIDVTFDRDMMASTFTGADVLRILGPTGPVNGPFTVAVSPANTDPLHVRTFRISFPAQELSGTYTITLGSDIQSARGERIDANLNAGLDVARGVDPAGATTPVVVNSTDVPVTISPQKTITSSIDVTDSFVVRGLTLTLNINFPNDPDLEAILITPDNTQIRLFTGVGSTGNRQNFTDTVFDDTATTPIQNGGAPFFGRFNPQDPLSIVLNTASAGRYTLQIKNNSTDPTHTGTLTSWSLTFSKPVPGTGLGEPVADRSQVSFRIFTMDPTNPLSSNTWTAVGPASINNGGDSGRIGGLALDPSDPSGNTVFVGGASGGVWKTTNFLTTSPLGPTYLPLTDFGPTFSLNIGGIAVFGRNNDPNQSIVFAATGEGDVGSTGVGILRSMDGGATWTLLDSSTNVDSNGNPLPINSPLRDHIFVGSTSFKIEVDPKPTVSGETIVYVALSGNNGGIWRSLDTGKHWQLMRGGQATDLALDPNSGFVNAVSNPTGNLQIIYGAFRGEGVFISSNQGQGWGLMAGGGGDPLIQDGTKNPSPPIPVVAPSSTPNGAKGRIVLAKPFLTGNPLQDLLYEGWVYAAVVATNNHLDGLYLTKDFGRNWTKLRLPNSLRSNTSSPNLVEAIPSNNTSLGDYDVLGGPVFAQGNYDVSLAIDPTNPNVVYLGGTSDGQPSGLIRVDATGVSDPYSFYLGNANPDGGAIRALTTNPVTLERPDQAPFFFPIDARTSPVLNIIQDPSNPFVVGATHYVSNITQFANNGGGVKWIPFDSMLGGSTDQHRVFSFKDPLTGRARLVFGDDQGVFTGVDAGDGTLIRSVGSQPVVTGSRNGNLQITQFYYGAAQPSNLAAQISVVRGLFYGSAQDDGFPQSDPNILNSGNLNWNGPGGDGGGIATDQTGTGTVYQYKWPCCGGNTTDFFQVNQVGRTTGLLQRSLPGIVPDPQWPFLGVVNFAVNPLNGDQAIISSVPSSAGPARVFRTETQGRFWLPIADPSTNSLLDGAQALALAYGAPDPNAPGGVGSLDNFLYFGTQAGHIYVTFTGGGPAGNQWVDISSGLDGSAVQVIVTNPTRTSHEAYAVTSRGVYHMVDSAASGATWQNITGNLFQVMHSPFGNANLAETQLAYTTAIQADWRYVIPDDFSNPNSPTHPMLYVAGEGGVYRSLDNGKSWIHFPDVNLLNTPQEPSGAMQPVNADREGGYLPNAHVTDLDLSLGKIDPTTGRPLVSTGPNILLASTYGRGSFAIRLAPIVFPNSLKFDVTLPPPGGSDSGVVGDGITNVTNPVIDGLSEESAFGNVVTITLIDLTDPNNPKPIPTVAGTNQTDAVGRFAVQVAPGYFKNDGSTDGPKVIGVQAVNASGTKGNIALFNFTLNTGRPGKPGAPDLEPGSDSGLSNSDNLTKVATGAIFDVLPSGPNGIAQNVQLLRDGVVVATVQIAAGAVNGVVQLTDPGLVSDGPHVYTAQQIDIAGNASLPSDPLTVTFDTGAPNNPAAPALDPNDDTGIKGDGQTQVRQPHLIGTLVPETVDPIAQVQIIDSNGAVKGTAMSAANGNYSVQFSSPLADGVYSVKIQVEDVAGNLSALSPAFVLQINNKLPAKPTISLLPADDSGLSNTDNITNVNRPRLIGKTDPGLNVDLIDTNGDVTGTPGAVLATVLSTGLGNYLIQFPSNLPDKVYHIQTRARDAANNTTLSDVLVLTIDTTAPATAPTLMLDPNDDTGIQGDGVTTVRRPHFIGATEPGGVVQIIKPTTGAVLATTTATAGGNFTAQLANDLNNGTIALAARATDIAGNMGPTSSPPFNLTIITVAGDYDSDGKADLAVFRPIAPTSQWFLLQSKAGGQLVNFGLPGDIPLQGDFDGDGKTDIALYRPSTATWFILRSQLGPLTMQFGQANVDIPVPADYDGDGRTDLAVYRPITGQWFIIQSSSGGKLMQFGQANVDRPEPGDYDGDGKADLAVYRPTTGQWFVLQSTAGGKIIPLGGQPGDIAVPGAYDGAGKTEPAIYRPDTGQWLIGSSSAQPIQFGQPNVDIPVPLDYDGDGKTDLAVYRPTTGQWFIKQSTAGPRLQQFGAANLDIPVPEPLDYRAAAGGLQTKSVSNGGSGSGSSGLRAASTGSNSFVNSIAVLAPSGGDGAALHTFAAPAPVPVPVPGPASGTPPAAISTPASVPTGPAITLPTRRRPVNTAMHRAHQPIRLTQNHKRPQDHAPDTALAAAIQSLGRIKRGRFFPGL